MAAPVRCTTNVMSPLACSAYPLIASAMICEEPLWAPPSNAVPMLFSSSSKCAATPWVLTTMPLTPPGSISHAGIPARSFLHATSFGSADAAHGRLRFRQGRRRGLVVLAHGRADEVNDPLDLVGRRVPATLHVRVLVGHTVGLEVGHCLGDGPVTVVDHRLEPAGDALQVALNLLRAAGVEAPPARVPCHCVVSPMLVVVSMLVVDQRALKRAASKFADCSVVRELSDISVSPWPKAVSMPVWPDRMAASEELRSMVIWSARALNESKAARPAPLNRPSSGVAASMSCLIKVPRSSLEPLVDLARVASVVCPISNFISAPSRLQTAKLA